MSARSHMQCVSCSTFTQIITAGALKMLFVLSIWIFTGVLAEEPTVQYYQLKHSSVCLHVNNTPPYQNAEWTFAGNILTVGKDLDPVHERKMDFNPANLTLCIKNLTNADSGIYRSSIVSNFKKIAVVHQVIVEEMVPKPVITLTPEHRSNLSAASCRIRANCSIQDHWLWSLCDENGCETSQMSFSKLNITLFSDNSTAVCIGNNHVSTKSHSVSIATKCFRISDSEANEVSTLSNTNIIIIILCVIFFGFCIAFTYILCSKSCNSNQGTSSALLIENGQLERQPRSGPRTSTSSSGSEADPSYENVDTPGLGGSIVPGEGQDFREGQRADTIYSIPQAPVSRVKFERSKDTSVNKDEQTTSESATQNQDQSLTQADTVYTMLQMPKNLKAQHHQEGD
ncbi:uncharacterized protein [Nothobranchius furzeri]|uniref:LOC107377023-like protein n=3 Tax=Nothobranchius furzeri TaxID=105023 RepID=A0A9D2Z1G8_NOTFU|nr:uncharacterized protein LOC107377023 [Nothobranchius furzeri]KAF7229937.1 putative LOC107377023-like protein [Nothobranchius furzeri]